MGWTGSYLPMKPSGEKRMRLAIMQEVDESQVVDSALVGTTVYLAMKDHRGIFGAVILTEYHNHEFCTKAMSDVCVPYVYDCPKRILDKLTPTDDENANKWRERCRTRYEEKKAERARKRAEEKRFVSIFGESMPRHRRTRQTW